MWWYHCIVMGLPFMLPSLNSSPFNAKKCSWAPKKTIFKRSYIDFYCGEEITLSSSSYFSESESKNRKEFQRCRLSVVQALANSYCCQRSGWKLHFVCRAIHCWPQAAQSSLTSNEILPQACVQTSAQTAAAANWHTEPQSSGIRLTRRQGEAVCVCVSVTHTCCGGIGAFVSFCVIVSLWASRWNKAISPCVHSER